MKDRGAPVSEVVHVIDSDNEMIGIPTATQTGINVKFLIRPGVRVGSIIEVKSRIYPAVNGRYVIVRLAFDVANRELPFYYDVFGTVKI